MITIIYEYDQLIKSNHIKSSEWVEELIAKYKPKNLLFIKDFIDKKIQKRELMFDHYLDDPTLANFIGDIGMIHNMIKAGEMAKIEKFINRNSPTSLSENISDTLSSAVLIPEVVMELRPITKKFTSINKALRCILFCNWLKKIEAEDELIGKMTEKFQDLTLKADQLKALMPKCQIRFEVDADTN